MTEMMVGISNGNGKECIEWTVLASKRENMERVTGGGGIFERGVEYPERYLSHIFFFSCTVMEQKMDAVVISTLCA